jgi:hypothetical protein
MSRRDRTVRMALMLPLLMSSTALADPTPPTKDPFATAASFSVDSTAFSLSSVVATIEPRLNAPGYSWVRIHFYSFSPTADDMASIENGNLSSMEKKRNKLADRHDNSYNVSHAMLQLSVDRDFKVWQADMSIPGHGCTIAPFEKDVRAFLQSYHFDGKILTLKSKASFTCDMKFMNIPDQIFTWDVDLNIPTYVKK